MTAPALPSVVRALGVAWLLLAGAVAAEAPPAPGTPAGAIVGIADDRQTVASGRAWLNGSAFGGRSWHLDGPAEVTVGLADLGLAPGHYRLGLVLRTGTRWSTPNDQLPRYRVRLERATGPASELGAPRLLPGAPFRPRREAGQPGSWANWYGTVQCGPVLELTGGERLTVANTGDHGGIHAIWALPVSGLAAASLAVEVAAPLNAFIAGERPVVTATVSLPAGQPAVDGFLRLERLDLLHGTTERSDRPLRLDPGATQRIACGQPPTAGVFRVTASLAATADAAIGSSATGVLYACAPARRAADLPDDWPLGTHVSRDIPPLPGFKWYRYFAGWHRINPARGDYHWEEFDAVHAAVRAAGGRLLIADDGMPLWISARGKAGMPWAAQATANPPDDWQDVAGWVEALVARYHDQAGTLGALELCNEANTPERWLGDAQGLVRMAEVFSEAVRGKEPPIAVIGIAVSAGDQRDYVQGVVDAGILAHVDAVSGHWYEELMSLEMATPINSLPRHVDLLAGPMARAGIVRPMINSECGVEFEPREGDRLPTQDELNRLAEAEPGFDRLHPWLQGDHWRLVSERRAAAAYVTGTVMLMALDVRRSFSFSHLDFLVDGVPSLPWVALGCLGARLEGVDRRTIAPLPARVAGSDGADGSPLALAYRIGAKDGPAVIVAWSFLSDTSVGRSRIWQRWLAPQPIDIACEVERGTGHDLYDREPQAVRSDGGTLRVMAGEEPVFIAIPAR